MILVAAADHGRQIERPPLEPGTKELPEIGFEPEAGLLQAQKSIPVEQTLFTLGAS